MASNSKQERRRAERQREILMNSYVQRFCSLFHNSVEVENIPLICIDSENDKFVELPKRYLLNTLLRCGAIAHDKATDMYLRFTKSGINAIGLPERYILYGYNGVVFTRDADEVDILRANDLEYPMFEYIEIQSSKLVDIDMAIHQNLDAVKTMSIMECDSEQQLLTLVNMNESRKIGSTAMYVSKPQFKQKPMNVMTTGAQYLCDKMQELRTQIMRETLSNLGFSVSNEDKKERVQSAELNTLNKHGLDAINVLVDTFNYDSTYAGLNIKLKANTEIALDRNEVNEQIFENKE